MKDNKEFMSAVSFKKKEKKRMERSSNKKKEEGTWTNSSWVSEKKDFQL